MTQLPAAIMKNGQLSTEMTSLVRSDDVVDDALDDATGDDDDDDDDWTATEDDDDDDETMVADELTACGEARTRCV